VTGPQFCAGARAQFAKHATVLSYQSFTYGYFAFGGASDNCAFAAAANAWQAQNAAQVA
jgi:hypothetical protein